MSPHPDRPHTGCPLCGDPRPSRFFEDAAFRGSTLRRYLRCPHCELVFVPGRFHLRPAEEKAEYDLHENNVDDPDYRRFLSRTATPLCARLASPSRGLDFGCGPGPALVHMLEEAGHTMARYDLYYHEDSDVLTGQYDFITCTEVVEHLARPGAVLARLVEMLHPGGWLAIMTRRLPDRETFRRWHYRLDPTHVCFFAVATFHWLADRHGLAMEVVGSDVVLLQTGQTGPPAAGEPRLLRKERPDCPSCTLPPTV